MKYRGYGLQLGELISEGNLGLIQSLDRFDPKKGFRLYIRYVVDQSFNTGVYTSFMVSCKNWNNSCKKKLFFSILDHLKVKKALDDGDLPPELVTEIADRLDVAENEVVDMNRRFAGHDHSLNNPYSLDNEEEWINGLPDEKDNHENKFIQNDELLREKRF